MKSFFQFLNEAQSQASMQAKKLNLKSDGHGGWLDSRGKFVATTEDGVKPITDKVVKEVMKIAGVRLSLKGRGRKNGVRQNAISIRYEV